ncbi:hypothetical protein MHYP_G00262120 [Metynnis hypsauchen]
MMDHFLHTALLLDVTGQYVNSTFSSLTITAVNLSDTGLYYCSTLEEKKMIFSTATHLQIRESCSPPVVFYLLTLLFGAVIAVPLSALLILFFIRQSDCKDQREQQRERVKYRTPSRKTRQNPNEVETVTRPPYLKTETRLGPNAVETETTLPRDQDKAETVKLLS